MTLASTLRPALDAARGIPGRLGLRPFAVTMRVTTWTGVRPGLGTASHVDTQLLVGVGTQNPKVQQVSSQDVVRSAGLYQAQDLRVGPLTPEFTIEAACCSSADDVDGGTPIASIEPPVTTTAREVRFLVQGPGMGDAGAWFERVSDETDSALHRYIVIRRTARQTG